MSKRIVYAGLERCDFIYQLAKIASLKGTVLLVDNSHSKDLFKIVSKDSKDDIIEWKNMHITKNLEVNASDTDEYDFIFIYAGLAIEKDYFDKDTLVLVMPDYTNLCLKSIEENIPTELDVIYIMRDFCTKKLTEKSIAQRLNIERTAIAGRIPLSLNDIATYIAFSHNGTQNIKALSNSMQEALIYTTAHLFGMDEKNTSKLIAKAHKL